MAQSLIIILLKLLNVSSTEGFVTVREKNIAWFQLTPGIRIPLVLAER